MADRVFKLKFLADIGQAVGQIDKLGDTFTKAGPKSKAMMATTAVGGAAMSAGIVSAFSSGIKVAASYEQAISGVSALTQASAAEQEQLFKTGQRIGSKTVFNARQAAEAMGILAQAGVSVADIVGGATDSVVALSAATGKDLAISANTAGRAMNIWKVPMKEMPDLVNRAAGVALAGSFDIEDLNLAMAAGGGVAKNAGVEWRDFFAVLASGSEFFSSGQDMGTSYKVFLQSLTPKTKGAATAMKELGLMTKEGTNRFYDQNGALVGAVQMADLLQDALAGLSEMEQMSLLEPIFGTDGIKMAQMLAGKGGEGIAAALEQGGGTDAAAMAAKRVDNLVGAGERLAGAIESLQLQLTPLLGPIAKGVDMLAAGLGKIPGPVLAGIAALGGLIVVISGAAAVFLPLVMLAGSLGVGVLALGGILLGIPLAIAAVIAIGVLLWKNWDTIKEKATQLKDWIVGIFNGLPEGLRGAMELLGTILLGPFAKVKGAIDGILKAKDLLLGDDKSAAGGVKLAGKIDLNQFGGGIEEHNSGGIVGGPRGAPRLVLAHGGETILPTHRRSGGGATNIFNFSFAGQPLVDEAGIERVVLKALGNATQRGRWV